MSLDKQAHYDGTACLDAIEAALGPEGVSASCLFNAIKYWWRVEKKGRPAEDAAKAAVYLGWWQDRYEAGDACLQSLHALQVVYDLIRQSSEEARRSDGARDCLAIIGDYLNIKQETP